MNRNVLRGVILMFAAGACSGYEKNAVQDITGPLSGAFVRFANFSPSAPSVNFYANNTKVSAAGTTVCSPAPTVPNPLCATTGVESTSGTASGAFAVSTTGQYTTIVPGPYTLTGRIAAATDKDLAISSAAATIATSKYYTFYQSGVYDATAKKAEAFVVEDPIPATFDYSQAYVRFVNAVSGSQPAILYARNQTTTTEVPLGATIAYQAAGAFTALPAGVYDLNTRLPNTATNVITRTGVTFVAGRVYTITGRATSATAFALDNTPNR